MMKKIFASGLLGVGITAVMAFVNACLAKTREWIIGLWFYGGEIVDAVGFGIRFMKFYPMSTADDPVGSSTRIMFDLPIFLLSALLTGLVCLLIGCAVDWIRRKKAQS